MMYFALGVITGIVISYLYPMTSRVVADVFNYFKK